jgi:hypothetical protein
LNSSVSYANRFGLAVTIAHYRTGASKWNPIEHRLFSEISKKLGARASGQPRKDAQIHSRHHHKNWLGRDRLSRPK